MLQRRNVRSGIATVERRWLKVAFVCIVSFSYAITSIDGTFVSTAMAQENREPGTDSVEPIAPVDQQIQVDPLEPGVPPVNPKRKRSNGLRKALLKPEAAADAGPPANEAGNGADDPGPSVETLDSEANAAEDPSASKSTGKEKKLLIPTDPVGLFLAGGHLMPVILVASIISVWFGLERMIVLRRGRVIPRAFVNRFLQHLEENKLTPETALRLCEENKSPIAEVFAHGVRKWGRTSVEVEQAIIDGGERQVAKLRTNLRVINSMANISPMLGLLGTVFGMIISFNELARGTDANRSERLANGIGHALITTAAGLAVAILSIILYMILSGKIDRLVMDMDELSQKVVNLISGEALASRPKTSAGKPMTQVAPTNPTAPAPTGKPKPVGT